jgi:glycolate oxidase
MTQTNQNFQNTHYKPIDQTDIAYFISVCGKDRVIERECISEDYCRDEMTPPDQRKHPEVLINIKSTAETQAIMKYCYEHNIPVTPRGQGTGLCGGCVPIFGGVLLNMSTMNKILDLDQENLALTVEPGVLIMEIKSYVEAHGLFYGPMPGEMSASIGGNISTNAGGMKAVKYGVTREWVEGIEVVLPDGELLDLGGSIVKNTSGYSLKDIIIGSEGTLGIVTKAVLKLIPLPKKALSILVPYPDIKTAIEAVPKIIIESKILPTSLEFMEREVILDAEKYLGKKFPDNTSDAYLLLTFDGNNKQELEREYEIVAEVCLKYGAIDVFISDTPERQESIWSARSAFLEAIKGSTTDMDECDVVVPRNQIAVYLQYILQLREEYGIRIKSFAHVGDGNLHIYVLKDQLNDSEWKSKLETIMQKMYDKAKELGGAISGEHGIGFIKKPYLETFFGNNSPEMKIMREIKKAFDPKNILNPGKIC